MSIKPPIKCPPDYSITCFRITECKKAGIVKGITTQLAIDLQDMFVPVTNYEERMITLKAGQTKKIDVSSIGEKWPLFEQYQFVADPANCGNGTNHTYSLYDESLTLIETMSIAVTPAGFATAFTIAYNSTTFIKNLVSYGDLTTFSTTGIFTMTSKTRDLKYRHEMTFDLTGFGGYFPFPYLHPGNIVTKNEKYTDPRIKIMLIYPDYYKANILGNCNCIDASGDMKSNKKYVEYAYADQYDSIQNVSTPITVQPVINSAPNGTQWLWNSSSLDHLGYHFKVGDMINCSSSDNPNHRGIITSIQGYFFTVDTDIGDLLSTSQSISHINSPNEIKWRKIGDFYLHTTAQDVLDTDYLYIETLYLKNPNGFDLPVKIMLAS